MITTSVEKLADPIGFDIANSSDTVQCNLINGLSRGFATFREENYNMQLAYIVEGLSKQSEKLIIDLCEFVKLKQKGE